jgi:chromosome partitioning protein
VTTTIIAVANQKGGVGKTTTAVTIAHGLTLMGKGTLLVDLDPQGQCATALGLDQESAAFRLLVTDDDPARLVRPTGRKGLGLIAGNKETSTAQIVLDARRDAISYVRDALRPLMRANGESPRYVVFDTAPSVGGLQERALWAADLVLIPSACDFLASDGVAQVVETMHMLAERFGWEGRLLGVLPTFFDSQTRQSQNTLDDLRGQFNGQLLEPVHRATVLRECASEGRTIFEYDGRSRAAEQYSAVVHRIVEVTA